MRRILALTIASFVLALSGGAAMAATKATPTSLPAKVTKYDFEDDHVIGEPMTPNMEMFGGKAKSVHRTLIRVRTEFIPELMRAPNDL